VIREQCAYILPDLACIVANYLEFAPKTLLESHFTRIDRYDWWLVFAQVLDPISIPWKESYLTQEIALVKSKVVSVKANPGIGAYHYCKKQPVFPLVPYYKKKYAIVWKRDSAFLKGKRRPPNFEVYKGKNPVERICYVYRPKDLTREHKNVWDEHAHILDEFTDSEDEKISKKGKCVILG